MSRDMIVWNLNFKQRIIGCICFITIGYVYFKYIYEPEPVVIQ